MAYYLNKLDQILSKLHPENQREEQQALIQQHIFNGNVPSTLRAALQQQQQHQEQQFLGNQPIQPQAQQQDLNEDIPSRSRAAQDKVCKCCNIGVPVRKWYTHLKTNAHKRNSIAMRAQFIKQTSSDFKNRLAKYEYSTIKETLNINNFLSGGIDCIENLIMESLAEHICVKFNFQLQAQYTKLCSDEWKKTIMHHTSKMSQITRSDSIENVVSCHVEEIKTKMSEFQERDSGWALVNIEKLYININKCTVLRGSQYIKTPKKLADRRACCNILNDDEYCFKWCMVAALTTPKPRNPTRTSSYPVDIKQNIITLTNGVSLNFNGLNFPMALRDIIIFEKNNPNISVNVLGYEVKTDHVVGPYYITQMEKETHVNLLLLENNEREHYVLVRDTSR